MQDVFKGGRAGLWTPERISRLSSQEIKQLRENAERLNEVQLAALCGEALKAAPTARGRKRSGSGPRTKARKLVARTSAFQGRGVTLQDPKTSWGGVRKTDGAVVMARRMLDELEDTPDLPQVQTQPARRVADLA